MRSLAEWGFRALILTICVFGSHPAVNAQDFTANWTAVSDDTLGTVRGGFQDSSGGVERFISFGISRAVFINGELVTLSALGSPGVGVVNPGGGEMVDAIQRSASQTVFPGGTQFTPGLMTIIQNTLDNQVIQNRTIVNATVSALTAARSSAFAAALHHAVVSIIGR